MKKNKESGEIVIEATIVVTICMLMIFLLISIGMYLYHFALVRIIANKTASDIALVYPYLDKEPEYGYMNYYDYMNNHPYRSFFQSVSNSFKDQNEDKAEWYAYGLIERMALREDEFRDAEVQVTITGSSAGGQSVKVQIIDHYELPLGGNFLGIIGLPETVDIKASASADVVDMLDQMATFNFVMKYLDKASQSVFGDLFSAVQKWLEFANNVIN